jgi:hypothetical protein
MKNSTSSARTPRLRALLLAIALVPGPVFAGLATIDLSGQPRTTTATMGALEMLIPVAAPTTVQGLYLTAQRVVL